MKPPRAPCRLGTGNVSFNCDKEGSKTKKSPLPEGVDVEYTSPSRAAYVKPPGEIRLKRSGYLLFPEHVIGTWNVVQHSTRVKFVSVMVDIEKIRKHAIIDLSELWHLSHFGQHLKGQ